MLFTPSLSEEPERQGAGVGRSLGPSAPLGLGSEGPTQLTREAQLPLLDPLCVGRGAGLADLCFCFPGKGDLIGCELPRREQVVKANADVKGLTYCVLQCLQLTGLHESLALYPEFAPRFSRGLRGELSYNLGAGGGSAEVRTPGKCMWRELGWWLVKWAELGFGEEL